MEAFPANDGEASATKHTISRVKDALPSNASLGGVAPEGRDFVHAVYGNFPYALGFVILRRLIEIGTFRPAAVPLLAGIALLGVGLIWNQQTLGDWRTDPYSLYSRTYFPFDKPGFGIDPTPPLRPLPPELLPMDAWSREVHEVYVPSAVPVAFAQRVLGTGIPADRRPLLQNVETKTAGRDVILLPLGECIRHADQLGK